MHEKGIKMKQQIEIILCDICKTTILQNTGPVPSNIKIYDKDLCIQCAGLVFYQMKDKLSKHIIDDTIKDTQDFFNKNKNIQYL
jgi:hypothetical protein